jgi:hypothetical protein
MEGGVIAEIVEDVFLPWSRTLAGQAGSYWFALFCLRPSGRCQNAAHRVVQ